MLTPLLWERDWAKEFHDAHLLGNGRLGASVYGGVPTETILINDDTLWSGHERHIVREGFYDSLLKAREKTLAGEYKAANDIINEEMTGAWGEAYMPLSTLRLTVGQKSDLRDMNLKRVLNVDGENPVSDYRRALDIENALATVEYARDGITYRREAFVSFPAQVVAVRLTAEGGPLDFALSMDSQLRHAIAVSGADAALTGIAPDHAEPSYTSVKPGLVYHAEEESDALRFAALARVTETDGQIATDGTRVYVTGASYAVALVAAGTNYRGYGAPRDRDAKKVLAVAKAQLDAAAQKGYEALKAEHIADYRALYGRVSLDLGDEVTGLLPTSARLAIGAERIDDPSLSALALQYSRYLLISGSRPGSQAENLQGIWNGDTMPPWSSNYTTNINVQMNYWPAETLALPECHEPMTDLVRETAASGERTAREYYHASGWVAHHNVDLWRHSVPACEDASFAWWPFGGIWMSQHLFTHYEYTRDKKYLESVYPVLRGAAEFLLDFLVEDADGRLVTAPSISPENKYILPGKSSLRELIGEVDPRNRFSANRDCICSVCKASAMDITMTRELFGNLKAAAAALGKDEPLLERTEAAIARLRPYGIGRFGQLMEWNEDFEECTPGMGHVSHLYALYPASVINQYDTPELYDAAGKSLLRRVMHAGMRGGWPGAWAISLAARAGYPDVCERICMSIGDRLGANMLTRDSVQIDAIFGWGAGVAEMLLQSQCGRIRLLPGLAPGWTKGCFKGFRARGGFEVSVAWEANLPVSGEIASLSGERCRLEAKGLIEVRDETGAPVCAATDGEAEFDTRAGARYTLVFARS